MASTTGIEIGPDCCALVGVRPGAGGAVDVKAVRVIEAASWPTTDVAQTETLREARRSQGFPRAARVVVWGLPEEPPADAGISRAGLRPITAAGFRIEAVMTPPQALAALAASRPRTSGSGAVAWLSLNMHGAAIAIVHNGALVFSRTFGWSYNAGEMSSKGQLLQRYTLVAHLAPELRRGIAAVRASHGVAVEAVVTCGDLPELRSLTMPLIEELDVEVETLDSTDGLRPVGKAKLQRFAESAPAIRLAFAAAASTVDRKRSAVSPLSLAAVAIVAALAWGGYAYFSRPPAQPAAPHQASSAARPPETGAPSSANRARVDPPTAPPLTPGQKPSSVVPPTAAQPSTGQSSTPAATTPRPGAAAGAAPPKPLADTLPPAPRPRQQAASSVTQAPPAKAGPVAPQPPARAEPVAPKRPAKAEPVAPKPPAPSVEGYSGGEAPSPPARPPTLQIARPPGTTGASEADPATARRPVPLKEPLPRVDSILIDQDRRLAIVDGAIVAAGDTVGSRVVAQIERNAVVFREPSGLAIRVPLRTRP